MLPRSVNMMLINFAESAKGVALGVTARVKAVGLSACKTLDNTRGTAAIEACVARCSVAGVEGGHGRILQLRRGRLHAPLRSDGYHRLHAHLAGSLVNGVCARAQWRHATYERRI